MPHKYQFLPDLTPEEHESLTASIAARGVEIPIIVDQHGNVVDGFHRWRACGELGIYCPREVRHFESEAEKLELALRLNCRRRQLTRKQRRELIASYLRRDPEISDNLLSQTIGGVSKNTVAEVRADLEATCQIDKFIERRGKDGKKRPRKYKRIIASSAKEAEKAMEAIKDLPDTCAGKTIDVNSAKRRAARNRNARERDEEWTIPAPLADDDICLYHCPFQHLESIAGIEPESVHLVCTDIPYGQSFLPEVPELVDFANRVLVGGGLFVVLCGGHWLYEFMMACEQKLTRLWLIASAWTGNATPVYSHRHRILNKWKPCVVYAKGEPRQVPQWCDLSLVREKEKSWHPWQQPLKEVETWVRYFSEPGDLVVDPCAGGFTTAVACLQQNRRFIGGDTEAECVNKGHQRLAEYRDKLQRELCERLPGKWSPSHPSS